MKKWIAGILIFLLIVLLAFYYFIPSLTIFTGMTGIKTSTAGAYRVLSQQDYWDRFSNKNYRIKERLLNSIYLNASEDNYIFPVKLFFIPAANDSVELSYESELPAFNGPISKWTKYRFAVRAKKNLDNTIAQFKSFVQKDENIYGLNITQTSTTDTFLIAKKFQTEAYPTTQEIYAQVKDLESHAARSNATRTGQPMLNVTQFDTTTFHCMVALPISRIVKDDGPIFFVRMVPGRFLKTEVKGGPATIQQAHETMQQYFDDYKRISMAIPFEYLVTDRSKEPDTSKWITRIYGPVY